MAQSDLPLDAPDTTQPYPAMQGPLAGETTTATTDVLAALRASEERLRTLVESVDEIVFELGLDGTYVNVWTNREELLARPREALLGRRVADVLGAAVAAPFVRVMERVIATGRSETMEYPLEVIGGTRWFLARISPIRAADGSPRTVCMIAFDITERKRGEAALAEATRLEGVILAAREVCHLLNNDLQLPVGLVDALRAHPVLPSELQPTLDDVSDWLGRAQEHLRQFQSVARLATKNTPIGPALDLQRAAGADDSDPAR
jgi:PAS domain S-box-containing protein